VPTYQYACTACGEQHEAVQAFSDAPLTECPACGGTLRKVFSAVGVVFKGSGFYKTDSRAAAKKDTAPSSGTSESAPATKTDAGSSTPAKTDTSASKPASTPAAKTA
jgi:putative FmdB family regulatory protein